MKNSSLPWVGLRPARRSLLNRHKHLRAWLVNVATLAYPGHSNNAWGPPLVPQLPIGKFWGTLALTAIAAAG